MKYCPSCGERISQNLPKDRTVRTFVCTTCGAKHFLYRLGEEKDLLEHFLENPKECAEKAKVFREEMETALVEEALEIENSLDTSMSAGNSLTVNNLTFFSTRFDEDDAEPLIARSLLTYGENKGIDIKKKLKEAIREYTDREINEDELSEFETIRKVCSIMPENQEKAYDNLVRTGRHGAYFSGSDSIVMERISKEIMTNISDPPEILVPLLSETTISDNKGFRSTLCHELTHAWLNKEVSNHTHDAIPSTLNEIFAHYISYQFTENLYSKRESDLYERPELISWGVRLLKDKFERLENRGLETNMLDFTRKMQVKVYQNSVNSYKANFKIFLRFTLFKEDKERLQKIRNLEDNLKITFGGLEHLLFGDAKAAITDPELKSELNQLREEIDWNNPEKIENRILEDLMDKAIDDLNGLYWVNSYITSELEKEYKLLKSYIRAFEKVAANMENSEFRDNIKKGEKQLLKVEKEIEQLLSNKYQLSQ